MPIAVTMTDIMATARAIMAAEPQAYYPSPLSGSFRAIDRDPRLPALRKPTRVRGAQIGETRVSNGVPP